MQVLFFFAVLVLLAAFVIHRMSIDECLSAPCMNNGTCSDLYIGYTCTCAVGFAGKDCEIDVNECASSPCQNGATCRDGSNIYTCTCAAGFTGAKCEIDIDECISQPCHNSGTCLNLIDHYICVCKEGYMASRCEIDSCGVEVSERIDCGWPSIMKEECERRGCCFNDALRHTYNCFHPSTVADDELYIQHPTKLTKTLQAFLSNIIWKALLMNVNDYEKAKFIAEAFEDKYGGQWACVFGEYYNVYHNSDKYGIHLTYRKLNIVIFRACEDDAYDAELDYTKL